MDPKKKRPRARGEYRSWLKLRKPEPPKSTFYRNKSHDSSRPYHVPRINLPHPAATPPQQNDPPELLQNNLVENNDADFEVDWNCSFDTSVSMSSEHSLNCSSNCDEELDSSYTGSERMHEQHSLSPEGRTHEDDYIAPGLPEDAPDKSFKPPEFVEFLEAPIHESLNVTKFEVLLMIMNFSFRHGLSGVAIEDLCKMINCMLGFQSIPSLHKYWIKKIFGAVKYSIHFYCSKCECYLSEISSGSKRNGSLKCPITACGANCNVQTLNDGNFFVTLSVKDQLKNHLENTNDVLNLLEHRWTRTGATGNDCISDVYDGSVYQTLTRDGNILADKYNLSVTCNTDGAVVFNSVKNTLYPIHLRINEFPPNVRFNQNNSLLAGLYFGKKEPNMSLFLAPFVREMNELYERGFEWSPSPEIKILSKVVLLQCVLDSVAKPKVQNMNQFNGRWSCGYCFHPGVGLDYVTSNHSKFLMNNDVYMYNDLSLSYTVTTNGALHHVEDRDDLTIRKDMEEAETLGVVVRGMKGDSALNKLPDFDLSFGFCIDYLHCVLLGVCKTLMMLLCDKEGSFYIGDEMLAQIEKKLTTISPPSSISRRPRPLSEMIHWKANEWRSWLLYYSLCCLRGCIPNVNLKHYCLLVSASFILLGDRILKSDIKKATWYLVQFVSGYSNLYGEPNVFYNVHLLLHLGKMVQLHGPWWCYSAFSFESSNGSLIKLVRGTKSVASQISEKYGICKLLPQTLAMYRVSETVMEYCEDLLCYRTVQAASKIGTITLLGEQVRSKLTENEIEAFLREGFEPSDFSYQRLVKDGKIYHARCYSRRGNKSDDSIVRLHSSGQYGAILRIIASQNTIWLLLRLLNIDHYNNIVTNGQARAQHIHCCSAVVYGITVFCNAEDIAAKAIFMECGDDTFVTDFPNTFEKD